MPGFAGHPGAIATSTRLSEYDPAWPKVQCLSELIEFTDVPTAIEARPIAHIGHHQARHEVLAQLGQPFERAAIVEDAHHAPASDRARARVRGMHQHLLFALPDCC